MRLGAVLVTVCMLLVAGSVGAVLFLSFGFSNTEAAAIALAVLSALALIYAATARQRDRSEAREAREKLAELARGTTDLARQVGDIGRRVTVLETELTKRSDRALAVIEPIVTEFDTIVGLLKRLAASVSAHETALVGVGAPAAPAPATPDNDAAAPEAAAPGSSGTGPAEARRFQDLSDQEALEVIRRALETQRIELHVQPIVTLPQRKVRYYEGLARLRTPQDELVLAADFLSHAEAGGLMPAIDKAVLFRCVQVVRRLLAKKRELGLFCNLSAGSLSDPRFFPEFSEFMQANRALTSSLVLEFAQAAVQAMGPLEHERLARLADLGFRFSLDHVTDLRMEPRELADRGFRFVKVPARLLLSRMTASTDLPPADFSDHLGRFGIDLIAEKIESESTAVDLLDFDVRFGQGFLFSPPRPVRSDALQAVPEPAADPVPVEAGTEASTPEPAAAPAPPSAGEPPPAPDASFPNPAFPGRRAGVPSQLAHGVVRRA